jgi:serine/threonine protein phosphatase PrpC
MNIAFVTNRGAVREENQDALCIAGTVRTGDMASPEILPDPGPYPALLAVIDGMGGYKGGAVAAGIVAKTLAEAAAKRVFSTEFDREADCETLRSLLKSAALRMADYSLHAPELAGMGAAASGILIREKTALVWVCGDCRVYRVSGGEMERLTREHSIVETLFEQGAIDEDGMRTHPRKNIVTSAISAAFADSFELYARAVSRCEEDAFFICSDGTWEALGTGELLRRLASFSPDAAAGLFGDLLAAHCKDNVSFIWQAR